MAKERYIVLLDSQIEKSIMSVEKGFSVSVTSSEFLSKEYRSFHIIDNIHAVLYKNLASWWWTMWMRSWTASISDSRSRLSI